MENADKLNIDTPEQVALEFPLAGIGSRFIAFAIDTILQALVFAVVLLASAFGVAGAGAIFGEGGGTWAIALAILVWFSIYWGYFALFETIWKGQTPGKREVGLRVIKDNGAAITARDAVSRNLLRAVDALPGFYGIGIISIFCSQQSKRLGDFVAGTVVVHEKPQEESQPFWNTREKPSDTVFRVRDMTPQEVNMLETFLARRLDMEPQVRRSMGQQIADKLAVRLELAPEQRPPAEDLIEAVVRQFRNTASFQ